MRGGEGGGVNLPAAGRSRRTEATCEDSRAPATRTRTNAGKGHVTAEQTAAIKQRLAACEVDMGHIQAAPLAFFFFYAFISECNIISLHFKLLAKFGCVSPSKKNIHL